MGKEFENLLEQVGDSYDIVILDSPASLAVTDPAVIDRYCATSVLTVRSRQDSLKEVNAEVNRLQQAGVSV